MIGPSAQQWSVDQLRDHSQGFHEHGILPRLRQTSHLLTNREVATPALCASIQGDHAEFMLEIERLLDQLVDDRWLAREDAERTLIEAGGRAITLIEARAESGASLEERIRCKRVLDGIQARGLDKEQGELRLLRGYVAAAAYLPATPELIRALISAVGHSDPQIAEGAVRALGAIASDQSADVVVAFAENPKLGSLRTLALAALAQMRGERSVVLLGELLRGGGLSVTETVALLRDLRRRPESAPLLTQLRDSPDPIIAAAARLELPQVDTAAVPAKLILSDRSELLRPFLGVGTSEILIADPVPGLARARVSFQECDVVDFDHQAVTEPGAARLFMTQGSLLSGELVEVSAEQVVFLSAVVGEIRVARSEVQGLALDRTLDRLVGASKQHDRVRLRSGELLSCQLDTVRGGEIHYRDAAGANQVLALGLVAGVLFKRPPSLKANTDLYTRIDLTTGDRLLVHLVAADAVHLGVVTAELGSAVVPISAVKRLEFGVGGGALWGFTLIADYAENRILEIDDKGHEVYVLEEIYGAWDVECLDNGNLLITEFALNSVKEVTRDGTEVWLFDDLKNPNDADRLPNGNTLIADCYGDRVVEVSPEHEIVWKYDKTIKPFDVERLANGNTLIADGRKDRVIEVERSGRIVWSIDNTPGVHDVDRLPNGNTLITQRTLHRVIEVDRAGNEVFRIDGLASPSDADRLPNGHTLIAEHSRIREYDRRGNKVWEHELACAVAVNRY